MDNIKTDPYYVNKIVEDLKILVLRTKGLTLDDLYTNEMLLDSIMFRLIQISENSDRLSGDFKSDHGDIPWHAIRGLRNRIVHEYGNVDLSIVFDTVTNDIPELLHTLESTFGKHE